MHFCVNCVICVLLGLPGLLCVQQAPVGGNLVLQPGFDVQQHLVFMTLLLDAGAHVGDFRLLHVDCSLKGGEHGAVTTLRVRQRVL